MADCSEYLELISRSVDGDLSAEEAERLYEHLAHCPSCSETLSSFEELSMMTSDSMKSPPAELRAGVMASIKAEKKRPWYARYRFTAVAACFALVILAISYTPLGDLFLSPNGEEVLTEQMADSAADTAMRAMPETSLNTKNNAAETPQIAKSVAPEIAEETVQTDDTEEVTGEQADAEPIPQAAGGESTPSFDPSLLPQTPYEKNFAKYLTFSAEDAPEVLYDITSDQTLDHTVYYIVTAEQFTAVQSALLEDGIEVQVIPGDPNVTDCLLILTITE